MGLGKLPTFLIISFFTVNPQPKNNTSYSSMYHVNKSLKADWKNRKKRHHVCNHCLYTGGVGGGGGGGAGAGFIKHFMPY